MAIIRLDAEGFLEDSSAKEGGYSGNVKAISRTVYFPANADVGSTGRFLRIPSNARFHPGSVLSSDDMLGIILDAGVVLPGTDIVSDGLYSGLVIDDLYDGLTLDGVGDLVDSIDKWNVPIWNFVGGLNQDPKTFLELVCTLASVMDPEDGELVATVYYTLP